MKQITTQKDIARRLGVSVTLVSRVLAGKAGTIGAAQETTRMILATAGQMGYVPNATARMLKGAPTRTLGVVVYDFEDPFLGTITGALHRLAHEHDYTLVLAGFEHRRADAASLRPLSKHGIDGLILVGSGTDEDWLRPFHVRRLRVARIGQGSQPPAAAFTVDNADGMEQILGHLAGQGYRSAGFLGDIHPAHQDRLRHFIRLAPRYGIAADPDWQIILKEDPEASGYPGIRTAIRSTPRHMPRAWVAASDTIAIGALRTLQERHVQVPARIALTGFDDIPVANLLTPSLTTLRQPVAAMTRAAFEWVTGAQSSMDTTHAGSSVFLKGELVVRETTRAERANEE